MPRCWCHARPVSHCELILIQTETTCDCNFIYRPKFLAVDIAVLKVHQTSTTVTGVKQVSWDLRPLYSACPLRWWSYEQCKFRNIPINGEWRHKPAMMVQIHQQLWYLDLNKSPSYYCDQCGQVFPTSHKSAVVVRFMLKLWRITCSSVYCGNSVTLWADEMDSKPHRMN